MKRHADLRQQHRTHQRQSHLHCNGGELTMTHPTPGQAVREAILAVRERRTHPEPAAPWDELPQDYRDDWESIAAAAIMTVAEIIDRSWPAGEDEHTMTARTLTERVAARARYRQDAIKRAERMGLTLRCANLLDDLDNPEHLLCKGESPGGSGCLCRCHDNPGIIVETTS